MKGIHDGPQNPQFTTVRLRGNVTAKSLATAAGVSETMRRQSPEAPVGLCTGWGIPFDINKLVLAKGKPFIISLDAVKARWFVIMHTTDFDPREPNAAGFWEHSTGQGRLAERAANYVFCYSDGTEERVAILRRHQIGMLNRIWGERCFDAVPQYKPYPLSPVTDRDQPYIAAWGQSQTRVMSGDHNPWVNWLWAWENPHPKKALTALRIEPAEATIVVSAISAGAASSHPLRWNTRRKAILKLPRGEAFDPSLDERGRLRQIRLDMGQVISAVPRCIYPHEKWSATYNNCVPDVSETEIVVEYAAHPDARFHLLGGKMVPVAKLEGGQKAGPLTPIASATQRVRVRVIEKDSHRPVAVKLHVHGAAGEYLAPVDRPRRPNFHWFEDYGCEFLNQGKHWCTYIPGETTLDLPLGRVYIEVSKGFEIRPVRMVASVAKSTSEITLTVEKALSWRERGWVTADTHVHFLSPKTAQLEGAGEGVNVVNLLASQWGELMTNVGDFDGKTTFGARDGGGDGEWLVRVGTENRQCVLGHISLLGYDGNIIAPMCYGGVDEAAIGDPVGMLLTEWARQCKAQNGVVVISHFPNPRAEHAATIVEGQADAIEMASWGDLYYGINPYSLADWYRYLNCGYFLPAVGGTDKMSALTAVGTIRTYARIPDGQEFTYTTWKDAIRAGQTFVTYGPLMEFSVEGKPAGSRLHISRSGGTVDISWDLASVTVPMSRVDLVVNGEVRESRSLKSWQDAGHFRAKIERSSWVAILVRGHYPDKPEMIAAHSSPVMVEVEGTPFFAAADALTILDQIEGALAFLDSVSTRAGDAARKRMKMTLTAAHRKLHNRLHEQGFDHSHTPSQQHREHNR